MTCYLNTRNPRVSTRSPSFCSKQTPRLTCAVSVEDRDREDVADITVVGVAPAHHNPSPEVVPSVPDVSISPSSSLPTLITPTTLPSVRGKPQLSNCWRRRILPSLRLTLTTQQVSPNLAQLIIVVKMIRHFFTLQKHHVSSQKSKNCLPF